MNLSKTAKRFLSSTMAIALAGGSVLAFRNSALAGASQEDTVSFTGDVALECAVETAGTPQTYNQTTGTVAGEERVTGLSATTTVSYDGNSDTVYIHVTNATSGYTVPTNATDLTALHIWKWGTGASADTVFTPVAGDVELNRSEATDANGDVQVSIESIWTVPGEEFFATTYTASLTFTVAAQ